MRRLRRPNVLPPTLADEGAGGKLAARHALDRDADPAAELRFNPHWNNADVRGALYAMQGWVCAYCQRELPDNDRGDVDHFRPKSAGEGATHQGYWWLAYAFDNLLIACSTCNRKRKLDRFPIEAGATHVGYTARASIAGEARLLLDPTRDQVEDWMKVDCMDTLCVIRPLPALAEPTARRRVDATIEFFKLNISRRLLQERLRARDKAQELYNAWKGEQRQNSLAELRRRASRYRPHGMTVRAFLSTFAPEIALPSPAEEMRWLLEEVDELLKIEEQCLERGLDDASCVAQIEELRWMLATLWHDPPPETFAEIEQWLLQTGFKSWIEDCARELTTPEASRARPGSPRSP